MPDSTKHTMFHAKKWHVLLSLLFDNTLFLSDIMIQRIGQTCTTWVCSKAWLSSTFPPKFFEKISEKHTCTRLQLPPTQHTVTTIGHCWLNNNTPRLSEQINPVQSDIQFTTNTGIFKCFWGFNKQHVWKYYDGRTKHTKMSYMTATMSKFHSLKNLCEFVANDVFVHHKHSRATCSIWARFNYKTLK